MHHAQTVKEKTILLVDDDRSMLRAMSRALHPLQAQIWFAGNAGEAIQLIVQLRPDLVFLDLHMPFIDGFTLMRAVKEEGLERIPIVLVTGDGTDLAFRQAFHEGCVYFIHKPFRNEQLRNIADYLLGDLSESERNRLEVLL